MYLFTVVQCFCNLPQKLEGTSIPIYTLLSGLGCVRRMYRDVDAVQNRISGNPTNGILRLGSKETSEGNSVDEEVLIERD